MLMKIFRIITLFSLLASIYILSLQYDSSVYQNLLINDFNVSRYFTRPLSQVEIIPDEFPNITLTTIPTKAAKANYYMMQNKLDFAKKLNFSAINANPFIGIAESNLSEIYFKEGKYDSSLHFAKIGVNKLPNNPRHIINLQRAFAISGNKKALDSIYTLYKQKDKIDYTFFVNHFSFLTNITKEFSDSDKIKISNSVKRFPENKTLLLYEKIINYGSSIDLSNELDKIANEMFSQKEYEKAIESWERAIEVVPTEDSYYLNIAQSLIILKRHEEASFYLDSIVNMGIEFSDGKLEFLKGLNYYEQKDIPKACEMLKISLRKNYTLSRSILKKIKCL